MAASSSDLAALASWDAVETRERIRAKDVTPVEVVEAAIARAEEARHLGAVVAEGYEHARDRARSGPTGELGGVPTFIKDLARVRDMPTRWGSRAAGRHVSQRTDRIVIRFEEAGVVTLGKSATPELGLTATTEPVGSPPCRNPWDPSRSSGGSSGGAATLVAAGVVPLAHASDGGGSIRIPAACCGLVGFKPSRSRLDMEGSNLLPLNVATDGVVTRSVRDTVAFYAALESRRAPKRIGALGPVGERPRKPLRVGVFVTAPNRTPVDTETRDAALAAGGLCEELGHQVEEIACPFESGLIDDFLRYWGFLAWLQVRTARLMLHRKFDTSEVEPWTRGLVGYFTAERREALAATRRLRRFSDTFTTRFARHDVLVSPTLTVPAPALGHISPDVPFETNFERLRGYAPFTPLYNAAGAPAISLPLGRSRTGLPIGVQFAAAPGADRTLLELARSLEEARRWPTLAPRQAWLPVSP